MCDLSGVKLLFNKAMNIFKSIYVSNYPKIITIIYHLDKILFDLGDLEGALANFEDALVINEKTYGSNNARVASKLN